MKKVLRSLAIFVLIPTISATMIMGVCLGLRGTILVKGDFFGPGC